jgi:hypothetical protein
MLIVPVLDEVFQKESLFTSIYLVVVIVLRTLVGQMAEVVAAVASALIRSSPTPILTWPKNSWSQSRRSSDLPSAEAISSSWPVK